MGKAMQYEPVMVMALVGAAIGLLVAFNVPITDEQSGAILKFVEAALPFLPAVVTAFIARSFAFAPNTVREIVAGKDAEIEAAAR